MSALTFATFADGRISGCIGGGNGLRGCGRARMWSFVTSGSNPLIASLTGTDGVATKTGTLLSSNSPNLKHEDNIFTVNNINKNVSVVYLQTNYFIFE